MTELTITDHTPEDTSVRRFTGLRRAAAVSAVVAFGLLTPAVVGASPASPSGPPPGPGDLTSDPGCDPDLPCDVDPDPDPDECDPLTEICNFTSGGNGPDDPCESETPPESCDPGEVPGEEPGGDPDVVPQGDPHTEVDVPVRATPNFTG